MKYQTYSHRFAEIIMNSNYSTKSEIEQVIKGIDFIELQNNYVTNNQALKISGRKTRIGMQADLNQMFRNAFSNYLWEVEKSVFNSKSNDLTIDFWKSNIGVDVAFNHRSFIGGDLLRLQAAGEVKGVVDVGVYICGMKDFNKKISKHYGSMVNFERVKWYLENFYAVLTVPIWLIGLEE